MSGTVWTVLTGAGALQGALLSVALLRVRSSDGTPRLLAFLLASIGLVLGEEFLDVTGAQAGRLAWTTGVTINFELLIGPLLFLYGRALFGHRPRGRDVLHFAPFITATLVLVPFYLRSGATRLSMLNDDATGMFLGLVTVKGAVLLAYIVATFRLMQSQSAPASRVGMVTWFRRFMVLTCALGVVSLSVYLLGRSGFEPGVDSDRLSAVVLTFALYAIAFGSLVRPRFIPGSFRSRAPQYATSPLTSEDAGALCARLVALVERSELYRHDDCSLDTVAAALGVPSHHVSQVLSQRLNTSFNRLMNGYRVNDAKLALMRSSSKDETLLDVGLSAGFNSKASFNRVFKSHTGMTPTEFRARMAKNRSQSIE